MTPTPTNTRKREAPTFPDISTPAVERHGYYYYYYFPPTYNGGGKL